MYLCCLAWSFNGRDKADLGSLAGLSANQQLSVAHTDMQNQTAYTDLMMTCWYDAGCSNWPRVSSLSMSCLASWCARLAVGYVWAELSVFASAGMQAVSCGTGCTAKKHSRHMTAFAFAVS